MAMYPGAKKRLIPKWNKVKIARHRRMNLHVAVHNGDSLFSMFSNSNSACSHFYVAKDGTVEQYIDTAYRSASDMHGNDSTISVETAGGVTNPDGEPWTSAQVDALVKLWKWARDTHGIKNQVAKNTQTNDNSAGLSWHRLGVEGNFAGRGGILENSFKPGGIKYSSARGKVCPGDAKILQIPGIWERANGDTGEVKPVGKPEDAKVKKVKGQSPTNTPNGSTTFPTDYAELKINGNFKSWEQGAIQILMHQLGYTSNKQWDGKIRKLGYTDLQNWLRDVRDPNGNPYYTKTPVAKWGVAKGTPLKVDGKDGKWFWYEFQRYLKDRKFYKGILDGDPKKMTYEAIQIWLNDNNDY